MKFVLKANVIFPEERGGKRIRNLLSRWHTLPPEAFFRILTIEGSPVKDASGGPAGGQTFT